MDIFSRNNLNINQPIYFDKIGNGPNLVSNNTMNDIGTLLKYKETPSDNVSSAVPAKNIINNINGYISNFYTNYIQANIFFIILAIFFAIFLYWKYTIKNDPDIIDNYIEKYQDTEKTTKQKKIKKIEKKIKKIEDLIDTIESTSCDSLKNNQGDSLKNNQGDSFKNNQGDSFNNNQGDSFNNNQGDSFKNNQGDSFNNNQGNSLKNNQGGSFKNNQGDSFKNNQGEFIANFNPSVPVSAQNSYSNYMGDDIPVFIKNNINNINDYNVNDISNKNKNTYKQYYNVQEPKYEYLPIIKNKINRNDTYTGLYNEYNNFVDQGYNNPYEWEQNYNETTYNAIDYATTKNRESLQLLNESVDNTNNQIIKNIM